MSSDKGFTLIEILVAVVIVGILCTVAIPLYFSYVQKARVTNMILPSLRIIEQNIALYYSTHSKMPTSLQLPIMWKGADTHLFTCSITNQEFVMTINSPNFNDRLTFFHGDVLNAKPMLADGKVSSFKLSGSLAEKMGFAQ